jgi:DNA-directed RNA polymerase subunit RPC12/RpoP
LTLSEGFNCPNCKKRDPHTHSCQEPVKQAKMGAEQVKKLGFYCINCGRVGETEDTLCQPARLTDKGKALFLSSLVKSGEAHVCQVCGQPVAEPGHICDLKGMPHVCEYCGKKVTDMFHICKGIVDNAKYTCRDCGRIAVKKESLCSPERIR